MGSEYSCAKTSIDTVLCTTATKEKLDAERADTVDVWHL
jgi:hypothetical protein